MSEPITQTTQPTTQPALTTPPAPNASTSKIAQILESYNQDVDHSFIPTCIAEWAHANGLNAFLQNSHRDNVARVHMLGMHVLTLDHLPDELKSQATQEAIDSGFEIMNGRFVISDCAIYVQSEGNRAKQEREAKLLFLQQDKGSLDAAREEIERSAGGNWPGHAPYTEPYNSPGLQSTLTGHATRAIPENLLQSEMARNDVDPRSLGGPDSRGGDSPVVRRRA